MTGGLVGYILHEEVGEGPRSQVWRGEAVGAPGRLVAVKRLTVEATPVALDSLRHQAAVLDRLAQPHIRRTLDVLADDGGIVIVSPFASRGSLAERFARGIVGMSPAAVAELGWLMASALLAAHEIGIVHGGVTPTNLLFDGDGRPLLADFGATRIRLGSAPASRHGPGPDVLAGGTWDPRRDIHGLGVVLHRALTGAPPFHTGTAAGRSDPAQPDAQALGRSDAPPVLADAVRRATEADPARRFPRMSDLVAQLDEARHTLAETAGREPPTATHRAVGLWERSHEDASWPVVPYRTTRVMESSDTSPRRMTAGSVIPAVLLIVLAALASIAWIGTREMGVRAPASSAGPPGEHLAERTAAPPCDERTSSRRDTRVVVPADVAGRGCSVGVVWDGRQLLVPDDDGGRQRYELGAWDEDVLVFGDWSCDGRESPALYRPGTGELFVFDHLAADRGAVTVQGMPTGVLHGDVRVLTDGAGCHRIEVS